MLSFLKPGLDSELNGNFDYWLCYSRLYSKRPFFIFLIHKAYLKPESEKISWFSFVHPGDYTGKKLELIDISDFTSSNNSNFLFTKSDKDCVDHPRFALTDKTTKVDAKPNQVIWVSVLNDCGAELSLDNSGRKLMLKTITSNPLKIQLKYTHTDKRGGDEEKDEYICNLQFHFKLDNSFYKKAWLDFGSEASQYGILDYHQEKSTVVTGNIFSSFKKAYKKESIGDNDFFQYDAGGEKLIKTRIYYSPENRVKNDNINKPSLFSDNDMLLFLKQISTSTGHNPDGESQKLLPYLKLLLSQSESSILNIPKPAGGDYRLDVRRELLVFTASILSSYCRVLINEVCAKAPDENVLINIYILFPNTLSQLTITYLLNEVHYKLNALPDDVKPSNFVGFELNACSESDASYLGDFDNGKPLPRNGLVLCIDCGKGTTDMGLYNIVDNKSSRLMRTGLPVAGNFLTFSVCMGILDSYVGKYAPEFNHPKLRADIIRRWLREIKKLYQGSDTFWNYIERAKTAMGDYDHSRLSHFKLPEFINPPTKTDLDGFVTQIMGGISFDSLFTGLAGRSGPATVNFVPRYTLKLLSAFFQCMYNPIERLNNSHKDYGLSHFKISQVKLSGRGMLFTAFRSYLKSQLVDLQVTGNESFVEPDLNDPKFWKSASIQGINRMDKLDSNSGILDPALAKLTGRMKSFIRGVDATGFNYIQRSDNWTFRFDNHNSNENNDPNKKGKRSATDNSLICGSHTLERKDSHGNDNKEYRLWFDGLQYRYSPKSEGNSAEKVNFRYEPEHEMKNAQTKVFTLISQFPNVSDENIETIITYLTNNLNVESE